MFQNIERTIVFQTFGSILFEPVRGHFCKKDDSNVIGDNIPLLAESKDKGVKNEFL